MSEPVRESGYWPRICLPKISPSRPRHRYLAGGSQCLFTSAVCSKGARLAFVRRYFLRCRLTQELTRPTPSDWTDLSSDWQILMTTIKTNTYLHSRWVVLGALAFMMCVSMALPIYGGSVLGTYMTAELHWERSTLGLLIAANMAANGLCAPLVAALTTKIGVRGVPDHRLYPHGGSLDCAGNLGHRAVASGGDIRGDWRGCNIRQYHPLSNGRHRLVRPPAPVCVVIALCGHGHRRFHLRVVDDVGNPRLNYRLPNGLLGVLRFFGYRPGGHPAVGPQ